MGDRRHGDHRYGRGRREDLRYRREDGDGPRRHERPLERHRRRERSRRHEPREPREPRQERQERRAPEPEPEEEESASESEEVCEAPSKVQAPLAPALTVSRCKNETISDIIAGVYVAATMNHGKVVYKKQEKSRGLDVLIYFWDDRDGPELCGWWFGPNVGGDQVWAYHPSRTAATPPASEWNVPHDGPIDHSFAVAMRSAAGDKASPSRPREVRASDGRRKEPSPVASRARNSPAKERNAPAVDSHAYFVDAYNRRRQERAKEQRKESQRPPEPPLERRREEHREEPRKAPLERPSDRKVERKIQDMKEVMERQAEEERRQVEELKRRADERKRREEEFQKKMQSIMEKPIADKVEERRRREEREEKERRPEADGRREGRKEPLERAAKRRREDEGRTAREEERRRDERRKEDEGERRRREEQERVRRDEEKRRKEEDMRRREEELQKRRNEKRRVEDEERRKNEEQRRVRQAEERRRDEERRKIEEERNKEEMERKRKEEWQRHEEELQRRAEEEKRRAAEEQRRREEEAKVLRQQQATLAVLRVLRKLSNASPEDFELLSKELQEVLASELPETGAQQEILKAEADRVLEYAKQYVEQVREQQKKWEELREQQQKKQQELEVLAREAVVELQNQVTSAEAASEAAHYTAAPFEAEDEMAVAEVLKLCGKVEKSGQSAMVCCQRCNDFLEEKKPIFLEAENIRSETTAAVAQVQPRLQAAQRLVADALAKAKEKKDLIAKRMATEKRMEQRRALFAKYDQDGDGLWSASEIAAYALGEFDFALPSEALDRMRRQIFEEKASAELLQRLKVAVGIARCEAKNALKRQERLEKERLEREERERQEAELLARSAAQRSECQALRAQLSALDEEVQKAEELAEGLAELQEAEASARLSSVQGLVAASLATLSAVQRRAAELSAPSAEPSALAAKALGQGAALRKALAAAEEAQRRARSRAFEEYEGLRMEVAAKLRVCIEKHGGKPDDLYDAIKSVGNGRVDKSSIKAYLESNQSVIEDEKLDAVLRGMEAKADPDAEIGQEDFLRVVRIFYKVVKEIVLSNHLHIEKSEQLRRMDVDEVMEVFQGPMLDPSVGVYRIHGKALKDGIVGWATVAGNQGITFLMPEGNVLRISQS